MLKAFFQSKEEKIRQKIDGHIADGMTQLSQKFYNGAMIEFDKAMEISPDDVYPRLLEELSNAASSGQLESALAIGLNLIKKNNEDYELANKLGNYARELKDYNQANSLYKTSLKIKKNYEWAFYNLAASQAKVDIFDEAIKSSLSKFENVKDYILPDYIGDEDIIQQYTEKAGEEKQAKFIAKLEKMTIERDQLVETGHAVEAKGLDLKIEKIKELSSKVDFEDILKEFQQEIKNDPENVKTHKFNLALHALQNNKPDVVLATLDGITQTDFDTVELLRALALEKKGLLNKAINKLHQLLGENEFNRYNNVNLGLLYRKANKRFLATKYLIKTAVLLDKSGGIYSMKELLKQTDELYEAGKQKKALNYYLIAVSEIPSADIWNKIGSIYVERKKYDDAVNAYREMKKLDPESQGAESKLQEIHDYYLDKGEQLFEDRKFKPAVDYFHKALRVLRLPETVKKTSDAYKQLNNAEKSKELLEEYQRLITEQKEKEQEEQRQQMILQGKQLLSKKDYIKAINTFETVFRMKVDRNVFMQLATLYKGLKRRNELASLEVRWEKMLVHDEKMKKFEKDQERMQQAGAEEEEEEEKMV